MTFYLEDENRVIPYRCSGTRPRFNNSKGKRWNSEIVVIEEFGAIRREFSTVFLKEHVSYNFVHTNRPVSASLTGPIAYK
jgi:hypothetical protein